jgi:hypothetical protein
LPDRSSEDPEERPQDALYDTAVSSVEWALMRAPERTYVRLVGGSTSIPPALVLGRVIVAALLIGAAMATTATGVADAVVVLRTTLAWSFVVVVQVVGASVLVASGSQRRVTSARAFDLLFAANGPWSLWLIGFTCWTMLTSPLGRQLHAAALTLAIPGAWTAYLVFAYCHVVLGETRHIAWRKAAVHQSAMWIVGLGYFFWAVQGWPRVIGWWSLSSWWGWRG